MSRIKSEKVLIGENDVLNSNSQNLKEACSKYNLIIEKAQMKAKQIIDEANNIKLEANTIKDEAIQILNKTNDDASKIIEKAKNDANEQSQLIIKKAFEEGSKKGYEEGKIEAYNDVTKELEDKILNVDNFTKSLFDIKKKIIRSSYVDILELVVLICEKITGEMFKNNDDILLNLIKEASLKLTSENEVIKLITNPKMYERLISISNRIKDEIPKLNNICIIEDNNVSCDGVIVESLSCRIDATLSSCIDELKEKLFNELKNTPDETIINDFENG